MTTDDPLPPDPNAVVADTAVLAANSAERAQAAAADAISNAQAAAAGVAVVAAEETRQSEERLAEWQSSIQTQQERLSQDVTQRSLAIEAKLAETMDKLLSIQSTLEPKPASPTSPDPAPSDPQNPESGEPPTEPAPPPSPPKKKAHRWI